MAPTVSPELPLPEGMSCLSSLLYWFSCLKFSHFQGQCNGSNFMQKNGPFSTPGSSAGYSWAARWRTKLPGAHSLCVHRRSPASSAIIAVPDGWGEVFTERHGPSCSIMGRGGVTLPFQVTAGRRMGRGVPGWVVFFPFFPRGQGEIASRCHSSARLQTQRSHSDRRQLNDMKSNRGADCRSGSVLTAGSPQWHGTDSFDGLPQ